ncbi:MAG: STAS domain-containing protein [Candidatus Krumholzibacteria bacterium]|nr:STAS domain-containing protein [Candidatus Krumholzibacteria bacterium]
MKIKERKRDGVAILEMSGKLMGGPDSDAFDETIKTLIHEGYHNVVVSMEKVKWVNSTGLGILISGYTTLKKSGGELKLLKVSDRIENIFIVSKLYTVFESFQDEEEAVRSFS